MLPGNSFDVLHRAWRKPFSTKSDFARLFADEVAVLASEGMITTKIATGIYQREWIITPLGIVYVTQDAPR
jgi:hypothetical protein